jgi:sRNA-binding carbon storage regulator CsrA
MLVLSRTPGRSIYFGRLGKLTVISIDPLDRYVTVNVQVPPDMFASVLPFEMHAARQQSMTPSESETIVYALSVRLDGEIRLGLMGTILCTDIGRGQARFGFDLPITEAVTRDDYSLSWHLGQQERRENRRPPADAQARSQ